MLTYIRDYVTKEEEKDIVHLFRETRIRRGTERNSILRYGSSLPYGNVKTPAIPEPLISTCERLYNDSLLPFIPDSVTINEYLPKQFIDWHIDSLSSGPIIVVLSLLAPATMGFRHDKGESLQLLEPRSLLLLSDEERFEWEHCIHPVPRRRVSIVFRKGTIINK